MNIKEIVQSGVYTEKKVEEPQGIQHCLNCGADFEGAYCPHCGQYWKVRRITSRNISESIVSNIIGFQANLPRTLIDLFYRPGYLIADYIGGRRKIYTNPFSTILLLATIFIFLNQYAMNTDIRTSSAEFGKRFQNEITTSEENQAGEITELMTDNIYDNFGLFNLSLIPILTLPFYWAYRKKGRYKQNPFNIYEATVAMAYFCCSNLFVSLVSLPFINPESVGVVTAIGYAIVIPLFLLLVWQMIEMKFTTYLWRTFLFLIYFAFILTIVMFGAGIWALISVNQPQ